MSLKVCLHIPSFGPGGAERQIVNLALELARRGVRTVLLHEGRDVEDAYYLEMIRELGIEVISAHSPEFLKAGMPLSRRHSEFFANIPAPRPIKMAILFLAGAFARLRPDIVHSYLDLSNCTAGCAAVLADVPAHVGSFRSIDPATGHFVWEDQTYPLYRYLIAHARPNFEANSRLGARLYARWLDIDPQSIAYSPNGLDPDVYVRATPAEGLALREALGIPPSAPVVLTLGRFCVEKSPATMLATFARVHAGCPASHYLIAGGGMTDREEMGTLVRERGLTGSVHLLGVRRDVGALLASADIFLLPSRIEGFPNAVMEAMAAGLPVVASNVGGIPDLVRHGEEGFLHEWDDADGMAQSVLTLWDDAKMRASFGASARQRILDEFSLRKLGDRVLARYEKLLEQAGARGSASGPDA